MKTILLFSFLTIATYCNAQVSADYIPKGSKVFVSFKDCAYSVYAVRNIDKSDIWNLTQDSLDADYYIQLNYSVSSAWANIYDKYNKEVFHTKPVVMGPPYDLLPELTKKMVRGKL